MSVQISLLMPNFLNLMDLMESYIKGQGLGSPITGRPQRQSTDCDNVGGIDVTSYLVSLRMHEVLQDLIR